MIQSAKQDRSVPAAMRERQLRILLAQKGYKGKRAEAFLADFRDEDEVGDDEQPDGELDELPTPPRGSNVEHSPPRPRPRRRGQSNPAAREDRARGDFSEEDAAIPADPVVEAQEQRRQEVKRRREAAEAEKRKKALEKVARKPTTSGGSSSGLSSEISRLEAALAAPGLSAAAAHGLKKQLATKKAAILRDERKRAAGGRGSSERPDANPSPRAREGQSGAPDERPSSKHDDPFGEPAEHATYLDRAKWHVETQRREREAAIALEREKREAALAEEELRLAREAAWRRMQDGAAPHASMSTASAPFATEDNWFTR